MKNIFFKLTFLIAFLLLATVSEAQIFSKKMPVGVKSYSFREEVSLYEMEFKDVKGTLDKYNFYNLDSASKAQKIVIVFDRKYKTWRLPLSYNEAMGIADEDGDEPLQRITVSMAIISPAIREKIE